MKVRSPPTAADFRTIQDGPQSTQRSHRKPAQGVHRFCPDAVMAWAHPARCGTYSTVLRLPR